jgi:spermidine/putrescine transport system substrate-binding protein
LWLAALCQAAKLICLPKRNFEIKVENLLYLEVFVSKFFGEGVQMKQFSKIRFWAHAVIVISLSLSACSSLPPTQSSQTAQTKPVSSQAQADQAAGSLLVIDWAGYEKPEFYQPFIDQHPKVKVDYSFMADDAESFAKAQNTPDFDLAHPCSNYFRLFVEKGLVQPIDTSRIKGWDSIYPELAKIGQIDGKQYFVPWDWAYDGILVRTDKVKNIPESWADLWNPEYKGHLSIIDAGEEAYEMTALTLGIDPYNATPEQDAQIKQKLIDLKPNLVSYWADPTEVSNLMASGDLWVVGNAWNESYVNLIRENISVKYIMPKEKAIGYVCGYSISSKTKNLDLAYDYINARNDPQSLANMANDQGYGPSNKEALALIDKDTVVLLGLDHPDILQNIFFMKPLTEAQHQHFTELWTEIKVAP